MPHPSRRRAAVFTTRAAMALAVVGGLGLGAQQALAGSSAWITVKNTLSKSTTPGYPQVALRQPGPNTTNCWREGQDLNKLDWTFSLDDLAVKPGEDKKFNTETKQGGAPCLTDYGKNTLGLSMYIKRAPSSSWIKMDQGTGTSFTAPASGSMTLAFREAIGEGDNRLCNWAKNDLQYCFVLEKVLPTFVVPSWAYPGPVCWTVNSTATNNSLRRQTADITLTVRNDAACTTPRGQTIWPSEKGDPIYRDYPAPENGSLARQAEAPDTGNREAQAAPDPGTTDPTPNPGDDTGKDEGTIVSFMSSAGVGCEMMKILPDKQCTDVAKNELSNLSNLSTDVRKFRIVSSFGAANNRKSICSAVQTIDSGAGPGSVTCTDQFTEATTTTTTTTHGWKVAAGYSYSTKVAAKVTVPAVGETSFETSKTYSINGEYNGSRASAEAVQKSRTKTVSVTQQALPGKTTRVEVFTQSADANFTFDADLDLGAKGAAEAVSTPVPQALGQSPSRLQHCMAYLVGGTAVNGSLMERQKRLLDSGYSPTNPDQPRAHQLFLQSAPFYRAGSVPCPGMPPTFPSTAGFKGTGVGTYASTGYGENGQPLETWTVCVYTMANTGKATANEPVDREPRRADQSAPSSPCVQQKQDGPPAKVRTPGRLVMLGAGGEGGATFTGSRASEEVIGTPDADTINAGPGQFQVVRSGAGNDSVDAVMGADTVDAGPGDDKVVIGRGDAASGGAGNDAISIADAAGGVLKGDAGADTLTARDTPRVVLDGGGGDDHLLVSGASSGAAMAGGTGNDRYVISGNAGTAPTAFEMPNGGIDRMETDRTVAVPLFLEQVAATGGGAVNLTARAGRQTLIGNGASNVLAPGDGCDVADGGGGNDAFLMNWDCPDTVTGGTGADLFTPLGTPATARNGGLAPNAMAHRITDFNAGEGDRIALRSSVFGRAVNQLSQNWQVVLGTAPVAASPGATILADTSSGLLAFDRDGSGPIIPKVIAMVPNSSGVSPSWFTVS